jgi:hypothetical protein
MCANGCILSDSESKFGRVSSIFACMTDMFTASPFLGYTIVISQLQDHEMDI